MNRYQYGSPPFESDDFDFLVTALETVTNSNLFQFRKFFVAWVHHFRSFLLFSKKMSREIKFTERTFSIARVLISAQ